VPVVFLIAVDSGLGSGGRKGDLNKDGNTQWLLKFWLLYLKKQIKANDSNFIILEGHTSSFIGKVRAIKCPGGIVYSNRGDKKDSGFVSTDLEVAEEYQVLDTFNALIPEDFLFSSFVDHLFNDEIDISGIKEVAEDIYKTSFLAI
jgi:hypothetical protein